MPKYKVEGVVTYTYVVEIEAKNEEDAEDKAADLLYSDEGGAFIGTTIFEVVVDGVDEVEEQDGFN